MDSRIKNILTYLPLLSGVFIAVYLLGFLIAAYLPFIFASQTIAQNFFWQMGVVSLWIGLLGTIGAWLQSTSISKKITITVILVLLSIMAYIMSYMGAKVANNVTVVCRHRTELNKVIIQITNKDDAVTVNTYEAQLFATNYYRIKRQIFVDTPNLNFNAYTCFGEVFDNY
ncbi:MAG: hypothetical protein KA783_06090 [Chitinophagales bacterium]|jgi:hypothetical protein|nr:hypothetical protein [Sphingobacteriales bacterium]MBP6663863.1 hypothetical protein [Chitinophagales bacterium]MBP7533996.1 hypothetical protein [Chitinophagales bacterium]